MAFTAAITLEMWPSSNPSGCSRTASARGDMPGLFAWRSRKRHAATSSGTARAGKRRQGRLSACWPIQKCHKKRHRKKNLFVHYVSNFLFAQTQTERKL
jgi:hypothetical protein